MNLRLHLFVVAALFATRGHAFEAATIEYRCSKAPAPSLISVVTPRFVEGTPDWKPGEPLPLREEAIVQAAKDELGRHVPKLADWSYDGMDFVRYRNINGSKFYCLVYFHAFFDTREHYGFYDIMVPVNLNGKVSPLFLPREPKTQ